MISLEITSIFLKIDGCIVLGKLINISLNQFPHQLKMDNKRTDLMGYF